MTTPINNAPALIILNPAAGGGRARRQWPTIARQLDAAGFAYRMTETQGPGEASVQTLKALQAGVNLIVAAGGDGTLNEVVNGFFERDSHIPVRREASLGILPLGTGSDFARGLGVSKSGAAIAALCAGRTTAVDLGQVEFVDMNGQPLSRYFVNAADLGLGADVARRVNRQGKRLGPTIAYLRGAIGAALAANSHHVEIQLDSALPIEENLMMIVVANNRCFGGGLPIAPTATVDDGIFDVVWVGSSSRRRLLFELLPRLYRATHLQHPAVKTRRATTIRIACDTPLPLELDGEPVGCAPAHITLHPRCLNCIVPATGR